MSKYSIFSLTRRALVAATLAASGSLLASAALAQGAPLKIGVLNDMSGVVVDLAGPGSVVAAKLAIEDFGGKVLGRPIELVQGDHLNKPDTGLTIARQWYDSGVRAIFDIGITTVALGMQDLAREKKGIVVYASSASSDLTGKNCSPNGIHWTYNTYVQSLGAIKGAVDAGGKSWYFITVDYTYGKNVQRDATAIIEAGGGKVLGSTTHPFTATDFSSQLLQAQASKADVIALATTTAHAAAMIKQADEFGLRAKGQKLAPLSLVLNDVKAMGQKPAQDLFVTEAYYWDQNDETRKFASRYKEKFGRMPNMVQASMYGAVMHYLKAVAAAGTDETSAVLVKMKSTPINDFMTQNGKIREDGRVLRDFYIFRIKKPSESKSEWDLYAPVSKVPAAQAFPAADNSCPLVK